MKAKHSATPWKSIFAIDKSRAVRNDAGLIATIYKPSRYPGQDERYEAEMEEAKANQKIIEEAPKMLAFIQEIVDRWPNNPWIQKSGKELIKKVTE